MSRQSAFFAAAFVARAACGACVALFATALASCSISPEIVSLWGGELSVPKLVSVESVSGNEIGAVFSSPVTVSGAAVSVPDGSGAMLPSTWEEDAESGAVMFILEEPVSVGIRAVLSATVTDERGNSLSFSVPFTGYNARPARLRINEIRTDYSKPKAEFVEVVALSAGNLGGIEISNAMNASRTAWEFPPAEVSAGDVIVYHLRSVEEGLVSETGDTSASSGVDAKAGARDFWDTLAKAPLKDTNVILVRERKGGSIMDALLTAAPGATEWPSDTAAAMAEAAYVAGAWKNGPLVADAVSTDGMTVTRTLGRNPGAADSDSAEDWRICAKGKASPGAANAVW